MSNRLDEIFEFTDEVSRLRIRTVSVDEEKRLERLLFSQISGSATWRAFCDEVRSKGLHVLQLDDPTTGEVSVPEASVLFGTGHVGRAAIIYMTGNEGYEMPTDLFVQLLVGILWRPSADELVVIGEDARVALFVTEDGDVFRYSLESQMRRASDSALLIVATC